MKRYSDPLLSRFLRNVSKGVIGRVLLFCAVSVIFWAFDSQIEARWPISIIAFMVLVYAIILEFQAMMDSRK